MHALTVLLDACAKKLAMHEKCMKLMITNRRYGYEGVHFDYVNDGEKIMRSDSIDYETLWRRYP